MKSVIFINNKFHGYDEERLKLEVGQLEWYLNRKKKKVHKIIIVNNDDELKEAKEYLTNTNELINGDGVITLEISDVSKSDNEIKEFIIALDDRGITFRAFHEFFNTENDKEKDILLKCLNRFCNIEIVEGAIPF